MNRTRTKQLRTSDRPKPGRLHGGTIGPDPKPGRGIPQPRVSYYPKSNLRSYTRHLLSILNKKADK